MNYPITFYNAIWLIMFASLFLSWSWWIFAIVVLFCPSWSHIREWHDAKKYAIQRRNAASAEAELSQE